MECSLVYSMGSALGKGAGVPIAVWIVLFSECAPPIMVVY